MNEYFRRVLRLLHDRGREVTPAELQAWLDVRYTPCSHDNVLRAIVNCDGLLRFHLFKHYGIKEARKQ